MKIRILVTTLPILAAMVTAGCFGLPVIPTFRYQAPPAYTRQPELPALGKIGVVAAEFPPQTDFNALLNNHQSAAVGGAAGAVAGKATEQEAKDMAVAANVKDVAGSISEALQSLHMQQSVRERVIEYGAATTNLSFVSLPAPGPATPDKRHDYTILRDSGVDSIVEVSILQARLGRYGGDIFHPAISSLIMTARARLIRVSDGYLMHEADYRFVSKPMTDVRLAADNAASFRQAFTLAYQDLAEQIVDRLFLIYEPPLSRNSEDRRCVVSPLRPEYPKSQGQLCPSCLVEGVENYSFATVNSLQPELRWESFPTQEDRKADQTGELTTLANVSYEVRAYEASPVRPNLSIFEWVPGALIDSHTTAIASHRLVTPLKACGHYFWTFRAHFTLNGQPRVTEWAGSRDRGLGACVFSYNDVPPVSHLFYPFKTECPQPAKRGE